MRPRLALAALLGCVAACHSGSSGPTIKLDGTPHPSTDAGIVTAASRAGVVLDGKRRYSVNPHLIVFIPGTLQLAPLAGTVGRYALIGASSHRVDWLEPLSVVATLGSGPPTVFFFGTLSAVTPTTATFTDGTVLTLGPGVSPPPGDLPARARADIDPDSHTVRLLVRL